MDGTTHGRVYAVEYMFDSSRQVVEYLERVIPVRDRHLKLFVLMDTTSPAPMGQTLRGKFINYSDCAHWLQIPRSEIIKRVAEIRDLLQDFGIAHWLLLTRKLGFRWLPRDYPSPPQAGEYPWTREREAVARELVVLGLSYGEISRCLGLTKSQLTGRAARQVYPKNPCNWQAVQMCPIHPKPRRLDGKGKTLPPLLSLVLTDGEELRVSEVPLVFVPKTCMWLEGDPRVNFRFCGARNLSGKPFCSEHAQLVYRPVRRKHIFRVEEFE